MHSVDVLDEAIRAARRAGYKVRLEWLGGSGSCRCVIRGQRWLFFDLGQPVDERLAVALAALAEESPQTRSSFAGPLRAALARQAA